MSSLLSGADTRLLSLVGPGGVGKTRLALRSVAEVSDRFPAGAYWVPCASIRAADDLLPAIAAAIGVRDTRAHRRLTVWSARSVTDASCSYSTISNSCFPRQPPRLMQSSPLARILSSS